jgi:hypothetical protein
MNLVLCPDAGQRTGLGQTVWLGLPENDDRSGGKHLRPSASPAADSINHALEMLEIAHAHPDERVRITGERERLDDLREVGDGRVDVGNLCSGSKAELDEGLNILPQQAVIQGRRIPADDSLAFEPVDASLCRWRRQADQSTDLARRATGVLHQSAEDVPVGLIERWSRGFQIGTQIPFSPFVLNDVER